MPVRYLDCYLIFYCFRPLSKFVPLLCLSQPCLSHNREFGIHMFATHPKFISPVQLDPDAALWRGVELAIQLPWFMVTFVDTHEDMCRTFMITADFDVEQFLVDHNELQGMEIIFPPTWSTTRTWQILSVIRIERVTNQLSWPGVSFVFCGVDGQRYGGYPIEPVAVLDSDVTVAWQPIHQQARYQSRF